MSADGSNCCRQSSLLTPGIKYSAGDSMMKILWPDKYNNNMPSGNSLQELNS